MNANGEPLAGREKKGDATGEEPLEVREKKEVHDSYVKTASELPQELLD